MFTPLPNHPTAYDIIGWNMMDRKVKKRISNETLLCGSSLLFMIYPRITHTEADLDEEGREQF